MPLASLYHKTAQVTGQQWKASCWQVLRFHEVSMDIWGKVGDKEVGNL